MSSWRESLSSIPGAITNLVSESASAASSIVQLATNVASTSMSSPTPIPAPTSTSTSSSADDSSMGSFTSMPHNDKSYPIPSSLVREQWRLIFTSDASARDLEAAIAHCHDLVLLSETCSEERMWLVRHLGDLRYALAELKDAEAESSGSMSFKTVVGHHFATQRTGALPKATTPQRCDYCTGIIWSMVQVSYICTDCQFVSHQKCVDSVVRVCAHITVSERQFPIEEICPEIGLAAQHYKCAECGTLLNFKGHWVEPRLCDYNGLYYCPTCHWNDYSIIPARVVHNWDFLPRKVSRVSLQEINLILERPLIKLEDANPKLFVFLEKLGIIKKLRQNLFYMRKYLNECKQATDEKLLETHIGSRRYLIQLNELYSIMDLEHAESGVLIEFLTKVLHTFDSHIRGCDMCTARAYICEICGNDEVIYPFDDCCIICDKCNSIYHRVCMTRKNMICPKCVRVGERRIKLDIRNSKRKQKLTNMEYDDDDDDDDDDYDDGDVGDDAYARDDEV